MPWPWFRPPFLPAPPPAPAAPPAPATTPAVDLEPFRIIADLAAKEYANENDRTKVLDAKSGPLIGATGAAIAFLIGAIVKPPDVIVTPRGMPAVVYFSAILAALVLLVVAQIFFLSSVRVRKKFGRFDLAPYSTFDAAQRPAWHLYSLSAGTYTDLVRHNTSQNDRKALLQDIGLLFLLAGTLVLVAIPITALVTILSA